MGNQNNFNKLISNLKKVQTSNNYLTELRELILNDPTLFDILCQEFELTHEELYDILVNKSDIRIATLDEMANYLLNKNKTKNLTL